MRAVKRREECTTNTAEDSGVSRDAAPTTQRNDSTITAEHRYRIIEGLAAMLRDAAGLTVMPRNTWSAKIEDRPAIVSERPNSLENCAKEFDFPHLIGESVGYSLETKKSRFDSDNTNHTTMGRAQETDDWYVQTAVSRCFLFWASVMIASVPLFTWVETIVAS